MTSRDRGELITQVGIIGASGVALPPIWVFPRARQNPERMLRGLSSGPIALAHKSGWMTSENFIHVLTFFVKFTRCSKKHKVLLIMDNHESHLCIEGVDYAKDNGIVLLTLPPHTSNKLQPLDKTIFGPFKSFVSKGINDWMIAHPGQVISIYDLPKIALQSWDRAATPVNIKSGFLSTGICPFDRSIFSDDDFLCSFVSDRPDPQSENLHTVTQEDNLLLEQLSVVQSEDSTGRSQAEHETGEQPNSEELPGPSNLLCSTQVTPESIRPYPKAQARKQTSGKGRKRGRSFIATDTPEKKQLEEKEKNKKSKEIPVPTRKKKKNAKQVKRKIIVESSSSDESLAPEALHSSDELLSSEEDNPVSILKEKPDVGDFVLVKYSSKGKQTVFYVGEVIDFEDSDDEGKEKDLDIKFYRKNLKVPNAFFEPQVEDIHAVECARVVMVLPNPVQVGGSKRQLATLRFPINLSCYNMR